jgi:hypothetical protein
MGDDAQVTILAGRTLWPVGMYGGDTFGGPVVGTVTSYRFLDRDLAPVTLVRNPRFVDFATDWEKTWSALTRKKGWPLPVRSVDPVVDASGLVVGHFGWVNGRDILIRQGAYAGGPHPHALVQLLLDGKPVLAKLWPQDSETVDGMILHRASSSEERFQLLMDIEGRVLAVTGAESIGLESADDVFWTLVGIGSLLVALGKFGGRQLIRSLTSKVRGRATRRQAGRTLVVGRGA